MDRDSEIASLVRREIEKVKHDAKMCNWTPNSSAWNRAFGELAGMYKILQLIDPKPQDADPTIWARPQLLNADNG